MIYSDSCRRVQRGLEHRPLKPVLNSRKGAVLHPRRALDFRGFCFSGDPQGGLAVGCFVLVNGDENGLAALSQHRGCSGNDASNQRGCHDIHLHRIDKPRSRRPRRMAPGISTKHPLGLNGLHPRNTTGVWFTLYDRPGVSVSDRGKRGPSGESNAPPIGIAAAWCAGRVF